MEAECIHGDWLCYDLSIASKYFTDLPGILSQEQKKMVVFKKNHTTDVLINCGCAGIFPGLRPISMWPLLLIVVKWEETPCGGLPNTHTDMLPGSVFWLEHINHCRSPPHTELFFVGFTKLS